MIEGTCARKNEIQCVELTEAAAYRATTINAPFFHQEARTYSVSGGLVKVSFIPYLDCASCAELASLSLLSPLALPAQAEAREVVHAVRRLHARGLQAYIR